LAGNQSGLGGLSAVAYIAIKGKEGSPRANQNFYQKEKRAGSSFGNGALQGKMPNIAPKKELKPGNGKKWYRSCSQKQGPKQ